MGIQICDECARSLEYLYKHIQKGITCMDFKYCSVCGKDYHNHYNIPVSGGLAYKPAIVLIAGYLSRERNRIIKYKKAIGEENYVKEVMTNFLNYIFNKNSGGVITVDGINIYLKKVEGGYRYSVNSFLYGKICYPGPYLIRRVIKDINKELKKINSDKFCDDCIFLSPTEEEQEQDQTILVRQGHFCRIYKEKVFHNGFHPKIQRISRCGEKIYNIPWGLVPITKKEAPGFKTRFQELPIFKTPKTRKVN